ncbi:MAG TPA: carboxypeptidase-like regulatory domain-containing protein [Candidatus Dormibacteraeota bacterium]|nr:carboxypeptidase-like regulatory domain-containing protein [Candidatus Dormibacteraeota bacterium]
MKLDPASLSADEALPTSPVEPMRPVAAFLMSLLLGASVGAQTAPGATKAAVRATIEGLVTKDPDIQPVKKAVIELIAENQAEGGDYTAVSGPDGVFRIENILPGRYHLFAERAGMLDAEKQRGHSEGRILTLTAGQELKDLHIRLQAAAVVRGRVTDEDGDPLPSAEVTVLRQTFVAGHSHWEQAGAERTNDLGEYRIANLPGGNVYVSVSPPPDFKSLIENAGVAAAEPHNPNVPEKPPATTYQTMYYPGTPDRSQASPIPLHAGDEFPVNFSLAPSPSLVIRGSVVNLPPRTSASIMLQSRDFSLVLNGAEMHKDGSFIIRDVSPGNYTILATVDGSRVPMMARQTLQVGSTNVEGLRLAPQPGGTVSGRLRLEGKNGAGRFDPQQVFLILVSVDGDDEKDGPSVFRETFSNLAHVAADGSFRWDDVPAGNYYVQVLHGSDGNEDWFVKSLSSGGRDVSDAGLSVNGDMPMLDLVASASGAVVDGIVVNSKGEPVANGIVVAVPEMRLRRRTDHYRKTVSDQAGHFSLRGIRPGEYTLFAWESVDGEAYYNPDFLKACEGQGSALHVSEGERKTVQAEAIPENTPANY